MVGVGRTELPLSARSSTASELDVDVVRLGIARAIPAERQNLLVRIEVRPHPHPGRPMPHDRPVARLHDACSERERECPECGSPEIVEGSLCRFRRDVGFPDLVVDRR